MRQWRTNDCITHSPILSFNVRGNNTHERTENTAIRVKKKNEMLDAPPNMFKDYEQKINRMNILRWKCIRDPKSVVAHDMAINARNNEDNHLIMRRMHIEH